jgi:hypothetical protein
LPYQGNESYFNSISIRSPIKLEKYFEFFEEKFHNEIDDTANSADTFILTSEHFHSKLTDINSIEKLRSLVDKKFSRIDIICYFREQSELARGSYFTSIVHGDYYDLDSHIQYVRPSNHYYNYFEMFSKWESVFGKESLYPRIYDRENLYEKDIRKDFIISVDNKIDTGQFQYEDRDVNASAGKLGLELARLTNRALPLFKQDGSRNPIRERIIDRIFSSSPSKRGAFGFTNAMNIWEDFLESNGLFAKKYLGLDASPFPPPNIAAKPAGLEADTSLTLDESVELLEDILSCVNAELVSLDSKLRKEFDSKLRKEREKCDRERAKSKKYRALLNEVVLSRRLRANKYLAYLFKN